MTNEKSICFMSLADAFLTSVTRDVQKSLANNKKIKSGLGVEVVPVYTDKQTFIENYLQHLYLTKQGIFCKQRSIATRKDDHFVYDCERSCFSRGASTGDPTKTRANGCCAYISFCFEEGATITLCVLRYRLTHTGHNPANREECKVNRIDSVLKANIIEWIKKTTQVQDVLLKIAKWNKTKGNTDYKDRKFFPTAHDIQQLIWSSQKTKQPTLDSSFKSGLLVKRNDIGIPVLDSLSTLLKTKYRDMCIFYQPSSFNGANVKPMILVLQTQHQKDMFRMHGEKLIFISKNYEGLRGYGCAIYSLVVKDEDDVAFPIAYILSNVDDGYAFIQALNKFQHTNSAIQPKAFFIDEALVSSSDGISTIYPSSKILIPRYQVLKAVHEWLAHSAVAEKGHKEVREVLLKYVLDLSNCGTLGTLELEQKVDYPEFTNMLKLDWLSCGEMWCDYGRNYLFTSTQNSFMVERLFLNLEHQLLKGLQTIYKPEDLVNHIAKDLNHDKGESDNYLDMDDFLDGTPEEQAENLIQEGWDQLVLWPSAFEALVPSQTSVDQFYSTKVITMECECPYPPFRGLCVHLTLALILIQRKAKEKGEETVEVARLRLAEEAFNNSDFLVERLSITTFHSGIICVTSLSDFTCTCKASFFGCECVGVLLSRKIHPQTTLIQQDITSPQEVMDYEEEEVPMAPTIEEPRPEEVPLSPTQAIKAEPSAEKTTQKLIEDLFLWSQSQQFVDSPSLHASLLSIMSEIQVPPIDEKSGKIRTRRGSHKETPYETHESPRRRATRQATRESPRKSGRIKTVLHYK
ncbi:hypothetical protein Avbf_01399 [Armadillidium vulgare]|nr:hypothetical protein Avbf_01399 [Armadillidium vulgare]